MQVALKARNMNLRGAYVPIKVSSQCARISNLDVSASLLLEGIIIRLSNHCKRSAFETVKYDRD